MSIEVKNISKFYGEQKALDNVGFSIKKGEIVFTKSLGESLTGLIPAFKKFLPDE